MKDLNNNSDESSSKHQISDLEMNESYENSRFALSQESDSSNKNNSDKKTEVNPDNDLNFRNHRAKMSIFDFQGTQKTPAYG